MELYVPNNVVYAMVILGTVIMQVGKVGENIIKVYLLAWIIKMILSLGLARNPKLKIVLCGERRVCNRYAEGRETSLSHVFTWVYSKC